MMSHHKQYILNLLDNQNFIQWLLCPSDEADTYWHAIMETDATHKDAIIKVQELVKSVKVKEPSLSFGDKQMLWAKINRQTVQKNRFRVRYAVYAATAAAAVWLVLLFVPSLMRNAEVDYRSVLQATGQESAGNDVCLILPDQKIVSLKDDNVELIYDTDGKVRNAAESALAQSNVAAATDADALQLNQLIVPYGKTSYVMLSDGSKIWVNSGSRLIYPSVFKPNKREIFVEGEIYIEVAKNERQPFVVKTDLMNVKVTGTSFNVQAYKDEPAQNIVLVSGAVTVANAAQKESVRLLPNQLYSYNVSTSISQVDTVDIYDYICWKYGFLHFSKEELTTVLDRLQKYYNVEIVYNKGELEHIFVSGKLDLKDNMSETLNSVALAGDVNYNIEGRQIMITKK
ncbi:anti-sigma factor [Bacteroidia bacterium]|nr:anti-sigma factor [Bacteroidia bacterium]